MFPRLQNTPYVGVDAGEFFQKICGNNIDGDVTFLSTMRALLYDRMGEGDTVGFDYSSSTYSKSTVEDSTHSVRTLVNAVAGTAEVPNTLHFHNFKNGDGESDEAWMNYIREHFLEIHEGYERVEKVHMFFEKHMDVECFINKELRSCFTFGRNLNIRLIHYFEVGIPVFLSWYFTDGMKPEEMELVEGLKKRTSDDYLASLNKLIQKYNIEQYRVKRLLDGIEKAVESEKLDQVNREIERSLDNFNDLQERIRNNLKARKDLEVRRAGLMYVIEEKGESSDILDYFIANKNLHLCDVSGSCITFVVTGNMEYFEEDIVESVLENKRSFIYSYSDYSDYGISKEDMGLLIKKVFLDKEIKLRVCAAYQLDISSDVHTRTLSSVTDDDTRLSKFGTYVPNPHIERYSCMGDYQYVVNECLSDGDYIQALEQCVASAISLNFADSTVMEFFMEKLYRRNSRNYNIKAFELPTGEIVDPRDAIKWIHENDKAYEEVVVDEETGEVL